MFNLVPGPYLLAYVAFGVATILVHVAFAVGVHRDASALRGRRAGPTMAGPGFWTLATLLGGVPVAVGYWFVHHSTLSRRENDGGPDPHDTRQPEI